MTRFQNILSVRCDPNGCNAVLDRAAVLARQNGAALTVLEVVAEESPPGSPEEQKLNLGRTVERIPAERVDVRTHVRNELAFDGITLNRTEKESPGGLGGDGRDRTKCHPGIPDRIQGRSRPPASVLFRVDG